MHLADVKLTLTWSSMMTRCYDPSHPKYKDYGGRGIFVCERWHDFLAFCEDMSPKPAGLSMDRIDNNAGYSPENCRWASSTTQARNTRATLHLTIDGRTMCASEWAKESGASLATISHRVHQGWDHKDAVFGRRFAKRYPGLTIDGVNLTVKQWAERRGLSYNAVKLRIKSGETPEYAISRPIRPRVADPNVTYEGETKPVSEWARLLGMKDSVLRSRIRRGLPVEKILEPAARSSAGR